MSQLAIHNAFFYEHCVYFLSILSIVCRRELSLYVFIITSLNAPIYPAIVFRLA